MEQTALKTSLYPIHIEAGARIVDFAGWQMPIQYSSIIEEHLATRNAATLFDVSHMGRVYLRGPDAEKFIDGLTTRKVAGMGSARIRYSLLCNEDGGILDDILVYRLPDSEQEFLCVVNASNREKILSWFEQHQKGFDVEIDDQTESSAMIAYQGPLALSYASELLQTDLSALKYFTCCQAELSGRKMLVSRTDYTGEDGCEIIIDNENAQWIWRQLAEKENVAPAGLGARDTLRLEAAMPLYGHELSETINAAQTGLGFALSMKEREFIGKSAIEGGLSNPDLHVRIGLILEGKRAAREGASILIDDQVIGEVTSGTFSPTLQQPIAMGYVVGDHSSLGEQVAIDIRGKKIQATITELPFYKREK